MWIRLSLLNVLIAITINNPFVSWERWCKIRLLGNSFQKRVWYYNVYQQVKRTKTSKMAWPWTINKHIQYVLLNYMNSFSKTYNRKNNAWCDEETHRIRVKTSSDTLCWSVTVSCLSHFSMKQAQSFWIFHSKIFGQMALLILESFSYIANFGKIFKWFSGLNSPLKRWKVRTSLLHIWCKCLCQLSQIYKNNFEKSFTLIRSNENFNT